MPAATRPPTRARHGGERRPRHTIAAPLRTAHRRPAPPHLRRGPVGIAALPTLRAGLLLPTKTPCEPPDHSPVSWRRATAPSSPAPGRVAVPTVPAHRAVTPGEATVCGDGGPWTAAATAHSRESVRQPADSDCAPHMNQPLGTDYNVMKRICAEGATCPPPLPTAALDGDDKRRPRPLDTRAARDPDFASELRPFYWICDVSL
mmetsp:Transcript_35830/g.73279  ORF Transcript_35830/g.73279 Transcript_35830/m.73279 type:complete len:204 (+) Transcript_35830:74-685(+)